ncbi:MAG: hypothetical protein Q9188_003766 [Gyalolechia gomerana]
MVVHTWQPETRWPQKTKFPLMELPLELRQIIYYQVFQSPVDEKCLSKVRHWNLDDPLAAHLCANQQSERNKLEKPKEIRKSKTSKKGHQKKSAATLNRISLLFVSKQVGAEAAEVLYNDCLFHAAIHRKSINLGLKTTRYPLHRLTESSAMSRLCNLKLSIYTVCYARSDKDREFPALARNLTIICNGLAANATQLKDLTIELPCFCGSIKLEPSLLDYLFDLVRTVGEILWKK